MAQMYPNQLDPRTESPAERELYAALRDGLDADYVVFHSVAWQSLDSDGRPPRLKRPTLRWRKS